tara:strand:+ start:392 stop:598 length:207 start_codon:yes stop_codon:yes gene_type:complete
MEKKYWKITNLMYSAYSEHTISNIFYGTWMEAAREAVKNTGVSHDDRSVEELVLDSKRSGYVINNTLI